jgi:hypothetical protein
MTAPPLDPAHEAFDRAMREFKSHLDDDNLYSEIFQTTSIQQVYDATDKLQEGTRRVRCPAKFAQDHAIHESSQRVCCL